MSFIINSYLNKKIELKKHLKNFGLVFFDYKNDYNEWANEKLNNLKINKDEKEKYLSYLRMNKLKRNYYLDVNFYNLVAKYIDLSIILHSMKSKDILVSGYSVCESLLDHSDILDLGCNAGYLSSFYSKLFSMSKVIGYDKSENSIKLAKKIYNKNIFKNLSFTCKFCSIKNKKFDYIIDTQCLSSLNSKELDKTAFEIFELLKSSGKLVTVSSLGSELVTHNFINIFAKNNLYVENMSEVLVNTIYGLKAYTKIVISKDKNNYIIVVEDYFNKLRKKISLLKVFDAF